jgi:glycosyltransferase involved in cell wall biosynthesis
VNSDEEEQETTSHLRELCEKVIFIKRKTCNTLSHRMLRIFCFLTNKMIDIYKNCSQEMKEKIENLVRSDKYDIVIYDSHDLIDYVDIVKRIPRVLYLLDSITLRMGEILKSPYLSAFNRLELLRLRSKIRNFEKDNYIHFSKCIVAAKKDRDTLLGLNPELDVAALPIYVDTEYFRKSSMEEDNIIIFTGVLWTEHNVDAVCYFYHDILPLIRKKNRNVSLLLVGGAARKEIRKIAAIDSRVKLLDFVEDIRPYLNRGTVFVSPMRIGSGMNNKLLEAMSMGKAIVTTEYGNREIGLKNGFEAVVCKDKYEFADGVLNLLRDREKRNFLGGNARMKAEREFSIEVYSDKLQGIIDSTISKWKKTQ